MVPLVIATLYRHVLDHALYQWGGGHYRCSYLVRLPAFIVCPILLGLTRGGFSPGGPRGFHLVAD